MSYVSRFFMTIVNIFICMRIIKCKCSIKKDKLPLKIFLILILSALKAFIVCLGIPPLNTLLFIIIFLIITKMMYECSFKLFVYFLLTCIFISLSADSIAVLSLSIIKKNNITEVITENFLIFQNNMINIAIQLILSKIIIAIMDKNQSNNKWYELIFYVSAILFEMGIFIYLTYAVIDYVGEKFIVIVMTGFSVLDIFMVYILQKISATRDAENKLKLMQQQEQLQMQMYLELQNRYDIARSISHDIYRHINSLRLLISENNLLKAEAYLTDLCHIADKLYPTIKNQNSMFAIILNILLEHCKKFNISLVLDIEDISLKFISDIDITTIFSNIFDNAVEACQKVEISKRKINVVLQKNINLITIKVVNSYLSDNDFEIKKISGIGISNIKKTVKKYNGTADINIEKENFEIFIILPVLDE